MIHSRSTHTTLNIETGTNVFDKDKVVDACNRTIEGIKTARVREKEEKVQRYMRPTWLFKRLRTREDALEWLDYDGEYSDFGKIDKKYLFKEQTANRIKRIAMALLGNTINLTAEEFLAIEPLA